MRIVDLFAGGGGASIGLTAATGVEPAVAVNHNPIAIAVHQKNHPDTHHYLEDVWEVDPQDVGRCDILWASPDCTHFSNAKAGTPKSQNIRCLAWVVVKWAEVCQPSIIFVENVPEFLTWGPLSPAGEPIKGKAGETFKLWIHRLNQLGYHVEWKTLVACDYGAPTSRKRLFIIARNDGQTINWPDATHGPGRAHPFRTAAECIDWSIPCPSVFLSPDEAKEIGVRRPLADKTMERIANGVRRYVLENSKPFIIRAVRRSLVHPSGLEKVCQTWLRENALFGSPFLFGAGGPRYEGKPTVMTEKAVGMAWMAKHFGGAVGKDIEKPMSTVKPRDNHSLCTAHIMKLRGTCRDGQIIDKPMPTVTAGGFHLAEVRAFLTKQYGTSAVGQPMFEPMHTVTPKDRFGLVVVDGSEYQIVDIGMRMLEPHELAKAQFGRFADRFSFDVQKIRANGNSAPLAKGDITRLIGNSVPPEMVEALVRANPIKVCDRVADSHLLKQREA